MVKTNKFFKKMLTQKNYLCYNEQASKEITYYLWYMLFFCEKEGSRSMKELNLGKDKINKLILAFSVPCVISMLINSVYNIVDQIFIGKGVGTLGNAATNVIFPLVIIFNAIAGLIGNGAAANLSLKLGENKKMKLLKVLGKL